MKKKVLVIIGILVMIGIILLFCQNSAQLSPVLRIGAILPLTGDLAKYGQSGKKAIELAVKAYNANNDRKVRILYEDDKGEPKAAINAINKLISADDVQIVVGAMPSANTLAIAPIAEQNKIVLISPTSTASAVRDAGDYIFRVCVSDDLEGKAMADYLAANQDIKNIGVLYVNNDYGVGLANDFEKEIIRHDGIIKAKIGYQEGAHDFRTSISKFQASNVSVLYIVAYKEQNYFFTQCAQLNYKPLFTGGTMIEDPDLLKAVDGFANGILYTYRSYNPQSQNGTTVRFVQAYKAEYNIEPDFYAAANYDAVNVALACVKNTEYDGTEFKDFIYRIKDMNGVTGKISFDARGDIVQEFGIKKIKNGQFVYISN